MRAVHGSLLKTLFSLTKSLVKEGKASGSKNPYIYCRNEKGKKIDYLICNMHAFPDKI